MISGRKTSSFDYSSESGSVIPDSAFPDSDFLFLDVGERCTGWYFERTEGFGTICCDVKIRNWIPAVMSERIISLAEELYSLQFRDSSGDSSSPRRVFIVAEDYAYGRAHMNFIQPETIGALKYIISGKDFISGLAFINIMTVKKILTGDGRATKGKVKKRVKELGYKVSTYHEADAIAAGYAFRALKKNPSEGMMRNTLLTDDIISRIY